MSSDPRTWMVLARDVSDSVRINGQSTVFLTLVLDVDTGLALGASAGASLADAANEAFASALETAPEPLEPGPPARVLCRSEHIDAVNAQLSRLVRSGAPLAEEVIPGEEAEGIFNMFVSHLSAGPAQA